MIIMNRRTFLVLSGVVVANTVVAASTGLLHVMITDSVAITTEGPQIIHTHERIDDQAAVIGDAKRVATGNRVHSDRVAVKSTISRRKKRARK